MNVVERSHWSRDIAYELSSECYGQFAECDDTRLARATREYLLALEEVALKFGENYAELDPEDFLSAYHKMVGDLHVL